MYQSQRRAQYKCFIFFFLFFIFFFSVKSQALAAFDTDGVAFAIRAIVPFQESFARLIENRSRVMLSETIRYPGEIVGLHVSLLASGKEVLREHQLFIALTTEAGKTLEEWWAVTDEQGRVSIIIDLTRLARGNYRFIVSDTTYSERILILEEKPTLSILNRPVEDDPEFSNLKKKKMALSSQRNEILTIEKTIPIFTETLRNPAVEKYSENSLFEMRSGP